MIRFIHAARQAIYAAKAVKDVNHNLEEFDASVNDYVYEQCNVLKKDWIEFERKYLDLMKEGNMEALDKALKILYDDAFKAEAEHKKQAEDNLRDRKLTELEAPTLMNVFREMLSCKKSLINALRDLRFDYV